MEKGSKSNGKVSVTRGQVTRFGFKAPTPPPPQLPSVPASPADLSIQETIEPLVIAPVLPKNGTPRMSRAGKEPKAPNRFGFIQPNRQLSNKVADLRGSQENIRPPTAVKLGGGRSLSETRYKSVDGKVLTSSSKLSNPQVSLAHPSPAHYRSNDSVLSSPVFGKMAKTVANNHTLRISNGYLSEHGTCKLKKGEDVMEIRQLEQSPGAATKFRHQSAQQKLARPMEMVFSGSKKFELRDLPPQNAEVNCVGSVDSLLRRDFYTRSHDQLTSSTGAIPAANVPSHSYQPPHGSSSANVHERIRREVVGLPPRYPITPPMTSSILSPVSAVFPDAGDEEKLRRDTRANEKTQGSIDDESSNEEELWAGPGEAMALEDECPHSNLADIDQSPESMNPPLRTVLLTVEDPTFATLAALSSAGLLEDETAPDSPDISCSSPSSVEPLPPPPPHISSKPGSPTTPGTPTHASNSSSSDTKDRDFLIDDEIADQPGLVFGSARQRDDEPSLLDRSKTIAQLAGDVSQALHKSLLRDSHGGSAGSISTLSPCESLASDDLMGDFDVSALDDLNDLDDAPLKSEIMYQSDQVMKEWSSILNSHPGLSSDLRKNSRTRLRSTTKLGAASQGDSTPTSHSTPKRHARRDETKSPGDDKSDDSGIKLGKDTMQHMYQDVINIKNMLMMLQRVLQQPETSSAEEIATSKIVLLEMENEEKDQRIRRLEEELKAANEARPVILPRPSDLPKLVNSSTQTDRVRPVTTLFHNSPNNSTASIVSSSETEKAGLRYLERPKMSSQFNSYKIS